MALEFEKCPMCSGCPTGCGCLMCAGSGHIPKRHAFGTVLPAPLTVAEARSGRSATGSSASMTPGLEEAVARAARWMCENRRLAMLKTNEGNIFMFSRPNSEDVPDNLRNDVMALCDVLRDTGAKTVG